MDVDGKITTIGTTYEDFAEHSVELGKVELNYDKDIFQYMSQNIVDEETGEKVGRMVLPNSRDFNFDGTAGSLPDGIIRMVYAKDDKRARGFIQGMYQQMAVAAQGNSNSNLHDILGDSSFVGYTAIFCHLMKSIYDPGTIQKDGGTDKTADFKIIATNISGVIFLSWTLDCEWGISKTLPKEKESPKSFRLCRSFLTYGSFLKRKRLTILTLAETDSYSDDGTPIEIKPTAKNKEEYWKGENCRRKRSLQQYLEMEIMGVERIKFKFVDGEEEELSRQDLLAIGLEDEKIRNRGEEIFKNMKTFLAKVLSEVQENLKVGHFCEIDFTREHENRRENGAGKFTISYKGPIDDRVLLDEFKTAFNL